MWHQDSLGEALECVFWSGSLLVEEARLQEEGDWGWAGEQDRLFLTCVQTPFPLCRKQQTIGRESTRHLVLGEADQSSTSACFLASTEHFFCPSLYSYQPCTETAPSLLCIECLRHYPGVYTGLKFTLKGEGICLQLPPCRSPAACPSLAGLCSLFRDVAVPRMCLFQPVFLSVLQLTKVRN